MSVDVQIARYSGIWLTSARLLSKLTDDRELSDVTISRMEELLNSIEYGDASSALHDLSTKKSLAELEQFISAKLNDNAKFMQPKSGITSSLFASKECKQIKKSLQNFLDNDIPKFKKQNQ